MRKFLLFLPLSLQTLASASDSTVIPEGKILDQGCYYPEVTPSAGPRVVDGCDVFLTGDYLCWSAREDNLQYAATGYSNSPDVAVSTGSVKNLTAPYLSGFKGGLGYNFSHDSWDSSLTYTWFKSGKNRGSIHNVPESAGLVSLMPLALTSGDLGYLTSASSLWKLHFNVIDWELGRNFYVSKYLSIRPFTGLKGTWQTQTLHNTYGASELSVLYRANFSSSFWGTGIRCGANSAWHLSSSWSLFGDLAISGLWGQFVSNRKDTTTITLIDAKDHFNKIVPVLEFALGIRKEAWFWKDHLHVGVQAAWEEQIWWDQNQFQQGSGGNLSLQGLTAKIRFDF